MMNKLYIVYINNTFHIFDEQFNKLNFPITSINFSVVYPGPMIDVDISMKANVIKEEWNGTIEEWIQSKKLENL